MAFESIAVLWTPTGQLILSILILYLIWHWRSRVWWHCVFTFATLCLWVWPEGISKLSNICNVLAQIFIDYIFRRVSFTCKTIYRSCNEEGTLLHQLIFFQHWFGKHLWSLNMNCVNITICTTERRSMVVVLFYNAIYHTDFYIDLLFFYAISSVPRYQTTKHVCT